MAHLYFGTLILALYFYYGGKIPKKIRNSFETLVSKKATACLLGKNPRSNDKNLQKLMPSSYPEAATWRCSIKRCC